MDLNPVFATRTNAIAADVRIVVDFAPKPAASAAPTTTILCAR